MERYTRVYLVQNAPLIKDEKGLLSYQTQDGYLVPVQWDFDLASTGLPFLDSCSLEQVPTGHLHHCEFYGEQNSNSLRPSVSL